MRSGSARRLLTSRRLRLALDLGWCAAFAATLALLLLRTSSAEVGDTGVLLELQPGTQRQAIYRKGSRLGTITTQLRRRDPGWRIINRYHIGEGQAARIQLDLRRDLSLDALAFEADVARLGRLSGLGELLPGALRELGRISLRGQCRLETGDCPVSGSLGRRRIDLVLSAGRGPVVTTAVYPLLARGTLGQTAEVGVFDPLSLRRRVIQFTVEGREQLELRSGTHTALRVVRDLEGMVTRVWLDEQGRVLREQLPMGFTIEHESWQPDDGR